MRAELKTLKVAAACRLNPRCAAFAGLAALSLSVPVVHASCVLEEIADFQVELVDNSPVIDGKVNGKPIRILLETGSAISYITGPAARQLGLPVRAYRNRTIYGVGGNEQIETALVREMALGPLILKDYTANVLGSGITDANGTTVFQLGADVLSRFTTEWDLAHGKLRLLHPRDCKLEQLAYWPPSYFQVNLEPVAIHNPSLLFDVRLNGKPAKARLVSGSAFSAIMPFAAREAGVEPGGANAEPAADIRGLTDKPIPSWAGRFESFEVGGEKIVNAQLRIAEVFPVGKEEHTGSSITRTVRDSVGLKLGADFLQAHHLIIVPDQGAALFTFNGGPVFQTKPRQDAAPAASTPD
jgi:hypothetical protein